MKFLLTSAWLSNKSIINALKELVWKPFNELNLAFIPTASNVEEWDKDWLIDDLINLKNIWFKQIDIVDISALEKEIWLKRLMQADILYFEWWNTFHLMYWIKKTWLDKILPELLKTRIYIWASAWGMITCKNLDLSTSKKLYYKESILWKNDESLKYFDFLVRPHLNSKDFTEVNLENMEKISKKYSDTFYVIDDQTAIKIDNNKVEIISEWIWKKFN